VQVRTEAEDSRRELTESCKYRSNSPVRAARNSHELSQGRKQQTHQSSEQLRSYKSSHRSKSLDLAHLDQRSDYGSERRPQPQKVDRVRRWDEQDQEYVLRFDDLAGEGSRHAPHYDHSMDPVERRLAKSQEGGRDRAGQASSSPRFSQHHNLKESQGRGPTRQKDPSREGRGAPKAHQGSDSSQQRYITPTHSQLSQGRKDDSR
jgi:hypothetical protein